MKRKKLVLKALPFFLFIALYFLFFSRIWLNPDNIFWGSDASIKHLPAREFLYNSLVENHEFPFYTNKIFTGFPIFADFELAYLNPVNVLSIVLFGPFLSYKILHLVTYIVSSYGMYIFLKKRGIGIWGTVVAIVIYLYSFFMMNHQLHFNLIMTLPLFPLTLIFLDNYYAKNEPKYIIFQALLFAYFILWGHPQTIYIMGLGSLVYSLFLFKKIKRVLVFWGLTTFLAILVTLPQLIPTYKLFKESPRSSGASYKQGSFNTVMFSNVLLPLQYGEADDYIDRAGFEAGYSYTEIYVYSGIAAFILGLFYFISSRRKNDWFPFVLMCIFLFYASARYLPLGESMPILTMFRHWNRAVLLFNFSLAFWVASLIGRSKFKPKINFKRLLALLLVALPLAIQFFMHKNDNKFFLNHAINLFDTSWKLHTVWFTVSILAAVTVLGIFIVKKRPLIFKILITLIILVDVFYYAQDPLDYRIKSIPNPSSRVYIEGLTDKMVIDYKNNLEGLQYLNANYRSPFGYSVFINADYKESLDGYGFGSRIAEPSERIDPELVEKINLEYVVKENGEIVTPEEYIREISQN